MKNSISRMSAYAICLALLIGAAACSPSSTEEPTRAAPTQTTAPETPAGPTATPTLEPGMFINPVLDRDFPDPDVLKVGDTYFAYSTNSSSMNIPSASSTDLVNWKFLGNALPAIPTWAMQDFGWVWAPDVTTPSSGEGYLMYFVARFKIGQGGSQCIGVATSDKPEGPFKSTSKDPFICQTGEGGSIDPASFVDEDGTRYLLWKNDGNSGGGPVYIYIQQVSEDGLTLMGEPTRILTNDVGWEGTLIEGPTLWNQDGKYYLFYSANDFNTNRYAVGYAVADEILGPYTKPEKTPLIKTSIPAGVVGPGGQDVVIGPHGGEWIIIHGWSPQGYRRLYIEPLVFQDGQVDVNLEPRLEPLPVP